MHKSVNISLQRNKEKFFLLIKGNFMYINLIQKKIKVFNSFMKRLVQLRNAKTFKLLGQNQLIY